MVSNFIRYAKNVIDPEQMEQMAQKNCNLDVMHINITRSNHLTNLFEINLI
jgi:hypothetical protein